MPPNTGSFASTIGGSDALKQAMMRRGIDASALSQVSPGSVAGGSSVAPAVPETASANAALGGMPQGGQTPSEEPESDLRIALQALTKFVSSESSLKKDLIGLRNQGAI